MIEWLLRQLEKNPIGIFRKTDLLRQSKEQFEELKSLKLLTYIQLDLNYETYPCSLSCENTCPMDVVKIDSKFYAICPQDNEIDPISLNRDELDKYQFCIDKFLELVRSANKLVGSLHKINKDYFYFGYSTYKNNRVGFVFGITITPESLLELTGLKRFCTDDDYLVIFSPDSVIEDVSLRKELSSEKIVQASFTSSLDFQTFQFSIDKLISGIFERRAETEQEKETLKHLANKLKFIIDRLAAHPKTQLLESIQHVGTSVSKLVAPDFSLDTVSYEESIYAAAAVIEYLTKRYGEEDDELVFWPKDWNECPEAYELYKKKIKEFRAAEATVNMNRLKELAEKLVDTEQKITPVKEPPKEAKNIFKKSGDFWLVTYQGSTQKTIKNSKGMFYIQRLLGKPEESISAIDLANTTFDFELLNRGKNAEFESVNTNVIKPQELIDHDYLEQCQKRLSDIETELAEARKNSDLATRERLSKEKKQILSLLKTDTFKRKSAKFYDNMEKARKAVAKTITTALNNIKKHNTNLYQHLKNSIQLGTYCTYTPDKEVHWKL